MRGEEGEQGEERSPSFGTQLIPYSFWYERRREGVRRENFSKWYEVLLSILLRPFYKFFGVRVIPFLSFLHFSLIIFCSSV